MKTINVISQLLSAPPLDWRMFKDLPEVIEFGKKLRERPDASRTVEERYDDATNGLALELCVRNCLEVAAEFTTDLRVGPSDNKAYDLLVQVGELEPAYIDVKGRFRSNATTYGQTAWEVVSAPVLCPQVVYLCFDCRDARTAKYEGWCEFGDFRPSQFGGRPTYIYPKDLRK
jgi:hypothetical protein